MTPHYFYRLCEEAAARYSAVPSDMLRARLAEVREEIDANGDSAAEMEAEAALFGDGPCGSAVFLARYRAALAEEVSLAAALRAREPAPVAAPASDDDLPF